jgi:ATPase subunit of ABC transporter with duplicated ATPase domains
VINAKADKLLAQEEVWVRKGVEARRTRSQGRIVRLEQLRARRAARRDALGRVSMEVATGQPSGKIVAELTECVQVLWKAAAAHGGARLQFHHPARRQGRPDRPQRRRQDHAAED